MDFESIKNKLEQYKAEGKKMFTTSSFQSHSLVLLHIISRIDNTIPVYFINTGFLFPETIQQAGSQYSPALVANYTYELVKSFNSFYQNVSILGADNEVEKSFRIQLSQAVSDVIKTSFGLLGIQVPNRM